MPGDRKPSSIQSIAWKTGLNAVKESINFSTFEDFSRYLQRNMQQNSEGVRRRYSNLIFLRLFPERTLEGINPKIWRAYKDEKLLEDTARLTTLEAEQVIAQFVLEHVLILPLGTVIENSIVKDFISSVFGRYKADTYERLRSAVIHMNFVSAVPNGIMVQPIQVPDDAFLLILHARLAPTPQIIRVSDILANDFWKLLGIRDELTVRSILRRANEKGYIARYAIVDQLEQITTRFSFDEYLAKALRL